MLPTSSKLVGILFQVDILPLSVSTLLLPITLVFNQKHIYQLENQHRLILGTQIMSLQ